MLLWTVLLSCLFCLVYLRSLKMGQPSLLTLPPPCLHPLFCSQGILVGFCPMLPASVAKRRHCLAACWSSLHQWDSLFPTQLVQHEARCPMCHDCVLRCVHSEQQIILESILCTERGFKIISRQSLFMSSQQEQIFFSGVPSECMPPLYADVVVYIELTVIFLLLPTCRSLNGGKKAQSTTDFK